MHREFRLRVVRFLSSCAKNGEKQTNISNPDLFACVPAQIDELYKRHLHEGGVILVRDRPLLDKLEAEAAVALEQRRIVQRRADLPRAVVCGCCSW